LVGIIYRKKKLWNKRIQSILRLIISGGNYESRLS
jgi:hypothetical protein